MQQRLSSDCGPREIQSPVSCRKCWTAKFSFGHETIFPWRATTNLMGPIRTEGFSLTAVVHSTIQQLASTL